MLIPSLLQFSALLVVRGDLIGAQSSACGISAVVKFYEFYMDWAKIVVLNFFLGEKRALNHHALVGLKAVGQSDFNDSFFVQAFYSPGAGLLFFGKK